MVRAVILSKGYFSLQVRKITVVWSRVGSHLILTPHTWGPEVFEDSHSQLCGGWGTFNQLSGFWGYILPTIWFLRYILSTIWFLGAHYCILQYYKQLNGICAMNCRASYQITRTSCSFVWKPTNCVPRQWKLELMACSSSVEKRFTELDLWCY